jgi:glycosyltransferase involved in cell wall biosynthesis
MPARSESPGQPASRSGRRFRLCVFRLNLSEGGAGKVTLSLLRHLDTHLIEPVLVLRQHAGARVSEIPPLVRTRVLGTRRFTPTVLRLAKVLREERPDVLLSASSGGNLVASMAHLVADVSGCRFIIMRHSNRDWQDGLRPAPRRTLVRFLYGRADRIVAVSSGVADELVHILSLPPDKVTVIYNPVVDASVSALASEPIDHPWFASGLPVILAVGSLVGYKDHTTLLHAFAAVRRRHDARLLILGEGELRASLERLAKQLGIERFVEFAGFVANPFPYMKRCTVYVLSSRIEGLPTALIEAMAAGAAVISTDCPHGPREIITHGADGLLVPVGDSAGLAEAMDRLLTDPGVRRQLGEAASKNALRFSSRTVATQFEELLLAQVPPAE